ncbi:MAG: glycosyltransferase family 39 protein [Bacteroidota bacterium]
MSRSWKNTENLLLLAILLIAAVLRFWNYSGWSLSNDELSALSRRNFGSLAQLVNEGIRPDFHPGGVQVFLYFWVKVFGDSEASLRFPFVIAGILSAYVLYLLGKRWFNASVGLMAALTLAVLEYPVLYSQLARPYSPGLMFTLLNALLWTRLLFDHRHYRPLYLVLGYSLSTTLCMYTHYFSFLTALITGITGLFFLNSENRNYYFSAGILSLLFFLPHLDISMEQFSRGGVGSWLGKPEPGYFWRFLSYSFNDSVILMVLLGSLLLISLFMFFRQSGSYRFRLLALAWFLAPFFIGYYYSVYKNPVLQYSILIFSFPFGLLLLYSFWQEGRKPVLLAALGLLAAAGMYSTVIEKKFYSAKPFATFREIADASIAWDTAYGKKNITTVINCIDHSYINYYFKKASYASDFVFLRGDEPKAVGTIQKLVQDCKTPYFAYAWTNNYSPYAVYELIREKYPRVADERKYFNSRITLFAADSAYQRPAAWSIQEDFEDSLRLRVSGQALIESGQAHSGNVLCVIDSAHEFACTMEFSVAELFKDSTRYINLSAWLLANEPPGAHLVIEFSNKDGVYEWRPASSDHFQFENGKWLRLFMTQKLPAGAQPADRVKVYIWNPGKKNLYLDDIRIEAFADADYDY